MDCDELIDELMSIADPQGQRQGAGLAKGAPPANAPAATPDAPQEDERVQNHRKRLAAIPAGGQAGQYGLVVRGKAFTGDQIDALDNSEIEKLYARYEARLGAAMTKTLGSAALQLFMRGSRPCFSRSKTSQGSSPTSREIPLSDTRLAAPPGGYITIMACS